MKKNVKLEIESYWDGLAGRHKKSSAIDPADTLGYKNAYISHCRNNAMRPFLEQQNEGTVLLDFGCGTGTFLGWLNSEFPHIDSHGVDISVEMLRIACAEHPFLCNKIHHYDGDLLPFDDNSIDVVTTTGVLLYLLTDEHLKKTCQEFYRITTEDGIVISVEQVRNKTTFQPQHWKIQRSPDEIISKFRNAGFDLIEWNPIRQGRFPLIYLVRYGILRESFFRVLAEVEKRRLHKTKLPENDYVDAIFVFKKNRSTQENADPSFS